ncbi:MAG: uroporphyrinogen decarboxylase family protein [Planctomycetota bacterium]
MDHRENILRAVRFERPNYIPARVNIGSGCWNAYPQAALQDLMAAHPLLFPGFEKTAERIVPNPPPWRRAGGPYTDSWGCVWETVEDGITGAVVDHALDDWGRLADYQPPSPDHHNGWTTIDWARERRRIADARQAGRLARGSLRHGHTFMTLMYLRGYENLLFDMVDDHPDLATLIDRVETFNRGLVDRYLDAGVEWMGYPEDLGMQRGPMLSPEQFRRYIKPTYERLIAPARDAGCVIHMHSDGDIRALADDLLDVGVDVINLQDFVNGLDWIEANLKGRVCIDLDIDRQAVTRFGTPAEIDAHLRDAVTRLGSPDGGLMMIFGLYPGTPLDNVKAVMDAMERYAGHFT